MVKRDAFLIWNEISSLVQSALGLSMLSDLDGASMINDDRDRETASRALPQAAVILLRRADDLLVSLERHLETETRAMEDQP